MKTNPFAILLSEYSAHINNLFMRMFKLKYVLPDKENGAIQSVSSLHTHLYVEIFCITEGELSVTTEKKRFNLLPGDIAFIPSEYRHTSSTSPGTKYYTVGVVAERVDSRGEYDFYKQFEDLLKIKQPKIYRGAHKICKMLEEISENSYSEGSPLPVMRLADALIELKEKFVYEANAEQTGYSGTSFGRTDISRLLIIEDIIYSRYTYPETPDEIAAKLFITRRHLDRIVREKYGKTLRTLINEQRIALGKRLLTETDSTVEKIAQRVGFSSAISFKNAFVAITGQTPTEYRRMGQGGC